MQWNVDWKIRGKTLSKLFWIFYAISILFFHPTAFLSSYWKRSVSRSRSFLLFHEGRQHVLENDEFTKKSAYYSGGWMFNAENIPRRNAKPSTRTTISSLLPSPLSPTQKRPRLNLPTSKLPTMHVRKLDSQRFSWRDKKKEKFSTYYIVCTTSHRLKLMKDLKFNELRLKMTYILYRFRYINSCAALSYSFLIICNI